MHPPHGLPCKHRMDIHAMSTWKYGRFDRWSETWQASAMLATHGRTGKMTSVNMPAVREELAATLQETLLLQQRLMDDVRDEDVPVADLVAQVSVLERLDDRRDPLIGELRRTASAGMRPARSSPPVREVLLATL